MMGHYTTRADYTLRSGGVLLSLSNRDGPANESRDFGPTHKSAALDAKDMASIPEDDRDLFEKKTFAHVATMLPDGMPHVTPVWIGYDADENRLLVNTERHRRKAKNVENDPRVGVSMTDPDDPYRALSVVGEVDEITTEGAREHIDELSQRYTGEEYAPEIQSERVLLKIRPDRVL